MNKQTKTFLFNSFAKYTVLLLGCWATILSINLYYQIKANDILYMYILGEGTTAFGPWNRHAYKEEQEESTQVQIDIAVNKERAKFVDQLKSLPLFVNLNYQLLRHGRHPDLKLYEINDDKIILFDGKIVQTNPTERKISVHGDITAIGHHFLQTDLGHVRIKARTTVETVALDAFLEKNVRVLGTISPATESSEAYVKVLAVESYQDED